MLDSPPVFASMCASPSLSQAPTRSTCLPHCYELSLFFLSFSTTVFGEARRATRTSAVAAWQWYSASVVVPSLPVATAPSVGKICRRQLMCCLMTVDVLSYVPVTSEGAANNVGASPHTHSAYVVRYAGGAGAGKKSK